MRLKRRSPRCLGFQHPEGEHNLKVVLPFTPSTTVHWTLKSDPRSELRSLHEDRLYSSPPSSTAAHVFCTASRESLSVAAFLLVHNHMPCTVLCPHTAREFVYLLAQTSHIGASTTHDAALGCTERIHLQQLPVGRRLSPAGRVVSKLSFNNLDRRSPDVALHCVQCE